MADRVVSYDFRGNFTNLTAGLAAAGKGVQDLGGKLTALDKNGAKMRAGLDTLGGAAGKLGLVAAAGLGAAVVASANFDQAMSKVQAATGESAAAMEQLRAAALKAGADTAFSASEAAAGVENLAKAGVSTADILGGGLTGALDLAAAGELDVAAAAEIAATAMTQFKLSGEDVPHIADLLAAGAGKAQGEVTDLAAALNQSGLVAGQMGLSIEETTGALAAFASAGLLGSDAGTSLKTMLLRLANPSQEAADTMADLGINAYDASGNLVSMSELAGQLEGAFVGMTQKQRDAALATIFGSDAIRAANVLYSEGADGIRTWTNNVDDAGFAAETAATKMDNLKGDLEAFMGSLETALIGTGDGAQGPLRSLVQGATAAVNAFNDLPGPVKTATSALLGLTAVFGGGLWFTSKVVGGIASTKVALENLGVSSAKTSKAMKGVAMAGAGLAALTVAAAGVRALGDAMQETLPGTEDLTTRLLDLRDGKISELGAEFDSLGESLRRIGDKSLSESFGDAMQTPFEGLFGESGSLEEAKAEIAALDTALAGLAASAGPEVAAQAFTALAESGQLTASQLRDLGELLPQYQEALDGAANSARLSGDAASGAAGATDDLAGAARGSAAAATDEAAALRDSVKAMQAKRDAALAAFDAETAWRQALKAAADQAKKNNAGIKGNTDAALENRNALSNLAGAWNGLSNQAQNMPGRFQAARKSFIDTAVAMGVPRKQAVALARELLEIPTKVVTTTRVDTGNSHAEIQGVFDHLTRLNGKTATTYVHVVRTGGDGDYVSGGKARASGGYISGPGTATSDSIPARLSNGEYVIKASSVAKYGIAMFDALNAQRFAEGGSVGAPRRVQQVPHLSAFDSVAQAMRWLATHANGVGNQFERLAREATRELNQRQRLFEKELRHAEKKMQAEKDALRELKEERRQFLQAVSSNFMSDLFGGMDLQQAFADGLLGSEFGQALLAWVQGPDGPGLQTGNIADYVGAYLATLTPDQIAALQAQATSGTLTQNTMDAQAFQQALEALTALGLDGGLFQELAASGNLSAAEYYATLTAAEIDALEQQYEDRNSAALAVGGYAASSEFRKDIREQTKEFRAAREDFREARQELKQLNRRIDHLEKLAEKNPKETGQETAKALNNTAGKAARSA